MKFNLMNSASLVKMDVLRGDLRLQEKEKKLWPQRRKRRFQRFKRWQR